MRQKKKKVKVKPKPEKVKTYWILTYVGLFFFFTYIAVLQDIVLWQNAIAVYCITGKIYLTVLLQHLLLKLADKHYCLILALDIYLMILFQSMLMAVSVSDQLQSMLQQ